MSTFPCFLLASQGDGWTPLHQACFLGRQWTVVVLLATGANVTARDVRGDVPCVGAGTGCIAMSVERSGSMVSWSVVGNCGRGYGRMVCMAAVQDEGWTALHRAADKGHVDVVKALLAAGSNVTATDVRGDVASVGGRHWNHCCVC